MNDFGKVARLLSKGENSVRQLLCLLCLLHGKEDLMPSDEEVVFRQDCSVCGSSAKSANRIITPFRNYILMPN